MQQAYKRCSPLRRYGFVVGIFLQSCYEKPISYSNTQQIIKQKVKKSSKNHVNNSMLLDIEPCSDQDEIAPNKQETKPKRIAIRKKRLATQSNKNTDKQPQLGASNLPKRRPLKRKAQHRVSTTSTKTTQKLKPKVLEEFHQDNLQADEDKQLIRPIIKRTEPQHNITHREATKTEKQQPSLTTNSLNISCLDDVPKSTIEELPVEVLQNIFSYISFKKMLPVRGVNHFFYTLTTGYNQVGVIGIQNKPDYHKLVDSWRVGRLTNFINFLSCKKFNQGIWNHQTIPSFIFYQFMEIVHDLPEPYWIGLPHTNLKELKLDIGKITYNQAIALGEALVGSKIQRLNLPMSQLADKGVEAVSKHLSKTNIKKIDLNSNHITSQGAKALFKNLQETKVKELNLSYNQIGSEGIHYLGEYIAKIPIETLDLTCNQIGSEGLRYLTEYITNTSINTLYLIRNNIEAEVIKDFLQALGKDTTVKQLYLARNHLTKEESAWARKVYTHIKIN